MRDMADRDELIDVIAGFGLFADLTSPQLEGIVHTTTMVAFKAYSRHDLESMWGLGLD